MSTFMQGYICAVTNLIRMHGCGIECRDLMKGVNLKGNVLKSIDPEDVKVLRENGLLPQKKRRGYQPTL